MLNRFFLILVYACLHLTILFNVGFALEQEEKSNVENYQSNHKFSNKGLKSNNLEQEYQLEILIFKNDYKNSAMPSKEIFNEEIKEINQHGAIDFKLNYIPPNLLSKAYDQLKQNNNYKILFNAATKYTLSPSKKNKKIIIRSDNNENEFVDYFNILLTINRINKNNFNISFDGNVNKYRLYKLSKIKLKEIYYFDHPMFGALITIEEYNNKDL